MASAASAGPRRARLVMLRVFILASSHRNNGYIIAPSNLDARAAHHRSTRAGRTGRSLRSRLRWNGAALEARHVAAGREGGVGVDRLVGAMEGHLILLVWTGLDRAL